MRSYNISSTKVRFKSKLLTPIAITLDIQNGIIFSLKNKSLTEQRENRADLSWYYLK